MGIVHFCCRLLVEQMDDFFDSGIDMEARMAMMAITTKSSIRVKWTRFILMPFLLRGLYFLAGAMVSPSMNWTWVWVMAGGASGCASRQRIISNDLAA